MHHDRININNDASHPPVVDVGKRTRNSWTIGRWIVKKKKKRWGGIIFSSQCRVP